MRAMMRLSVASSSGVQAEKDLSRATSASDATRPSVISGSSPSPPVPGSLAGTCSTACVSIVSGTDGLSASCPASRWDRKKRPNTRS